MTTNQQLTRADLEGMTLDEVGRAHAAGRLDDLLGVQTPTVPAEGQLSRADVASMTPEQITEAQAAGRLCALLDPEETAAQRANEHRLGDVRSLS